MGDIQFDKAEFRAAPGGLSCAICQQPVRDVYWEAGGRIACQSCRDGYEAERSGPGPGARGYLLATALGLAAGLVGALVWFLVEHFLHLQAGLVALLVGWLVGKGVRRGSGGWGGRGFQVLAVLITYASVALAYVPAIMLAEEAQDMEWPARLVASLLFAPAVPVLSIVASGFGGILSALILGFALWEAWRSNARVHVELTGPHRLAPPGAAAPPPIPPGAPTA